MANRFNRSAAARIAVVAVAWLPALAASGAEPGTGSPVDAAVRARVSERLVAQAPANPATPVTSAIRAPEVVTLKAALAGLLDRHPLIDAARQSLESAEAGRSAAWREFLPDVRIGGDYGREYISNPSARATDAGPGTTVRRQAGIIATQPVFDGLRRSTGYGLAERQVDLATAGFASTRDSVLFEGASVFYEVLRQVRLAQLAVENEQRIQEQFRLEDERVQQGSGIAVDVLQAKARLQIARERRVAFEGALREAVIRYRQVFAIAPNVAVMIEPSIPPTLIPEEADGVKEAALDRNPVLRSQTLQVEAAKLRKKGTQSAFYPRLDIVAGANWESDVDGPTGIRRDRSILLVATWELTGGFIGLARSRAATAEIGSARSQELQTRRKVEEEADLAWQALDTARERARLLGNAVNIAAEVLRARLELRNAGRETALNVLDAESELYAARISEVSALFDAKLAELRLLAVMGDLSRLVEG